MKNPPKSTPAQQNDDLQKMMSRSLLEVLLYQSLIDEIEECVIRNKQPYLLKTYEEIKEYPELLDYSNTTPSLLTTNEKSKFYFHLEGVEIASNGRYPKATAEDNMHNNIQLTVVYC